MKGKQKLIKKVEVVVEDEPREITIVLKDAVNLTPQTVKKAPIKRKK